VLFCIHNTLLTQHPRFFKNFITLRFATLWLKKRPVTGAFSEQCMQTRFIPATPLSRSRLRLRSRFAPILSLRPRRLRRTHILLPVEIA
jgi:hypothetical protein